MRSVRQRPTNVKNSHNESKSYDHAQTMVLQAKQKSKRPYTHSLCAGTNPKRPMSAMLRSFPVVDALRPIKSWRCRSIVLVPCCVLLVMPLVFLVTVAPFSVYLTGDDYSSDGGVLGAFVDEYLARRYAVEQQNSKSGVSGDPLRFPDVTIKATRKTEKSHGSVYLEEILQRHQPNQTSATTVVSPRIKGALGSPPGTSLAAQDRAGVVVKVKGAENMLATLSAPALPVDLLVETCQANWLCQRCLNTAYAGKYTQCTMLCRRCYIRLLTTVPNRKDTTTLALSVVAKEDKMDEEFVSAPPNNGAATDNIVHRRIPRIVHQIWIRHPRNLVDPELARLQSGWRSSKGYQYFFHTPNDQEAFVEERYPAIVGKAFAKVVGQEHRDDLFRLLVLYQMGGIFASLDLMLETQLDALVDTNTAFFASRASGLLNNCLWNGLVGAEPGHPIVGQAIVNILRTILLGSSSEAVDESLAQRYILADSPFPHSEPIWKLRAVDSALEYIYSGCALGLAYNQVLKSKSLFSLLPIGLHEKAVKGGDLLILLTSERDTGATRITDIDRNLLVASTDLQGLDFRTVKQRSQAAVHSALRDKAETVE